MILMRKILRAIGVAMPDEQEVSAEKDVIDALNAYSGIKLFDEDYYIKTYKDVNGAEISPILHFIRHGWKENRNPSENFDTEFYKETYLKGDNVINPVIHYLEHGAKFNFKTKELSQSLSEIKEKFSSYFDEYYYRATYADISNSKMDLLEHFILYGAKEGRNPNSDFNTLYYIAKYGELIPNGTHPYYHYLTKGKEFGFQPVPQQSGAMLLQSGASAHVEVDILSRKGVSGWAWCPAAPELSLLIEARVNGRVIGRGKAETMREDLLHWGKGTGKYGFSFDFYEWFSGTDTPELFALLAEEGVIHTNGGIPTLPPMDAGFVSPDLSQLINDHEAFVKPGPNYEDPDPTILENLEASHIAKPPFVFAYYLPQFHTIPVNDHFWGKGFTEWRQLSRAMPRFPGHYQPRIPRDLGFYDLTDPSVLPRQAELAKAAGINAFCYYYYWFNGQRVLERPLNQHMDSNIDMPFMIMWANENWTKTWDGSESDVLLLQDYLDEDEDALLADLARHFVHPQYVRIDGRPLFFLYNPKHVPDSRSTIQRWREKLQSIHGLNPLFFMAQTFAVVDPTEYGLDGAIEFPPHKLANNYLGRDMLDAYAGDFKGRVIGYEDFVEASLSEPAPNYPLIKTIVPSWDNDARRPGRGLTLERASPQKYQDWLEALVVRAIDKPILDTPLVAVNAWNEWAEAAYLEPDIYYGGAYLNATARAIVSAVASTKAAQDIAVEFPVSVILPCYNHSRFLEERINSVINQKTPPAEIIFLDDASTDDSVEVARRLLEQCKIPWRIEVNERNSGNVFTQWLKGLELARHNLIWIAETDDSVDREFLYHLLPAFKDNLVSVAFGRITCIDPEGRTRDDLANYFDGLRNHNWDRPSVTSASTCFAYDFAARNIIPNASGCVFRRSTLSKDQKSRLKEYKFAGDWYFYALALRGGALAYQPLAKSWFRVNPESASRSSFFTDRHLCEHKMVLEDISNEYGVTREGIDEHARRLAVYINRDPAELAAELAPVKGERKLRICIAAHSFSVGGGEVVPLELANQLKKRGHHVTYLVVTDVAPGAPSIRQRLLPDIPVVHWDDIKNDVPNFLNDYKIDVINSHNVGVDYKFYCLNLKVPCAYVASLHGGYETVKDLLQPSFISYLRDNVSCWLPLSAKNREVLEGAGLKAGDFRESFNAISGENLKWASRQAFRKEHGLSSDDFALVICSRAIKQKGWLTAIEVCKRLNQNQDRAVHLFMIGNGPDLEYLRSSHTDDSKLHFLGHVENPLQYYKAFDAAIFPSTYSGETFPMFLVECLMASLPVISTDIGEISRILGPEGQRAGLTVSHELPDEKMIEEMTRLVQSYMDSPSAFETAQNNARLGAHRLSMDNLVDFYLNIFNEKTGVSVSNAATNKKKRKASNVG